MSTTLDRPPPASRPTKSSSWAWLALATAIVLYPLALGIALAQQDPGNGDVIFAVLTLLPPILGIVLGVRSGRTGNRSGALAAAAASAWLTYIVVFIVGANSLWSGESLVGPAVVGAFAALLVAVAVDRRVRHTSR